MQFSRCFCINNSSQRSQSASAVWIIKRRRRRASCSHWETMPLLTPQHRSSSTPSIALPFLQRSMLPSPSHYGAQLTEPAFYIQFSCYLVFLPLSASITAPIWPLFLCVPVLALVFKFFVVSFFSDFFNLNFVCSNFFRWLNYQWRPCEQCLAFQVQHWWPKIGFGGRPRQRRPVQWVSQNMNTFPPMTLSRTHVFQSAASFG